MLRNSDDLVGGNGEITRSLVKIPRAFQKEPKIGYGSPKRGNTLIQGENLAVLRMLEQELAGSVKCIYIDPPYNNQENYAHYTDNGSHKQWISDRKARLKVLQRLLREDGSIWISIDDREIHYLKVAADEIFGRENFVTTIVWHHRTTRENRKVFSNNHEYLLVYAKAVGEFKKSRNMLPLTEKVKSRYKNPDGDPRGPWQSVSANVQAGHATPAQFYEIIGPSGRQHRPPNGRCWVYSEHRMLEEIKNNNVWFGRDGNGVPRLKRFLKGSTRGLTPETLWLGSDVGTTKSAKKHLLKMFSVEPVFDTPKPEELVKRIFEIATNPNELILDSYLGSGTTCAVAHKMGRQYIGIEKGEHAVSLCAERLRKVIDGEKGGISEELDWRGGGGFSFYRAPPVLP